MKLAVYIGVYACIRDDWMLAAIEEEITLFRFRLRIRQHLVAITLTFYSFFFFVFVHIAVVRHPAS